MSARTSAEKAESTPKKNSPSTVVMITTMIAVATVSLRVGQVVSGHAVPIYSMRVPAKLVLCPPK